MLTFCFAAAFPVAGTLRDRFAKCSKWGSTDSHIRIRQHLLSKLPQSLYLHLQLDWGLVAELRGLGEWRVRTPVKGERSTGQGVMNPKPASWFPSC